jgi:hypothetical protein
MNSPAKSTKRRKILWHSISLLSAFAPVSDFSGMRHNWKQFRASRISRRFFFVHPHPTAARAQSSNGVLVTNARITSVLLQLVSNPLMFRLDHRHTIDKSSNVVRKTVVAVFRKQASNQAPTALHRPPRFYKGAIVGFDAGVAFPKFGRDSVSPGA